MHKCLGRTALLVCQSMQHLLCHMLAGRLWVSVRHNIHMLGIQVCWKLYKAVSECPETPLDTCTSPPRTSTSTSSLSEVVSSVSGCVRPVSG